ncbi:CLIPD3 family protein [Megaselia abdita]
MKIGHVIIFDLLMIITQCHAQLSSPSIDSATENTSRFQINSSQTLSDLRWVSQDVLNNNSSQSNELNLPRLLSDSTINKISETLGVLNHVGHFLVDMTRGGPSEPSSTTLPTPSITPPSTNFDTTTTSPALTSLNKTYLNVKRADSSPLFFNESPKKKKKHNKQKITKLESVAITEPSKKELVSTSSTTLRPTTTEFFSHDQGELSSKETENRCKTPDGKNGRCEDLSSCPVLLLNLNGLRESLCFKSLFVPGVCCPLAQNIETTKRPVEAPFTSTQNSNLILIPQIKTTTTTPKPPPLLITKPSNISSNKIDIDECGQQEYSVGRIVGGIEAENGQWPWMAAIFLHGPKRTEFWCGGSLIGERYILTAAHCTRDSRQRPFAARQFTVRLGDIDLSTDDEPSEPVTFAVKEVRAHEKFSRIGFYNDIAILVLDKPARKSKYVIPLCLPKNSLYPQKNQLIGKRATVVGWGTTYYGGKESTNQRQADLPIWRNDDCDKAYFQPINENFLCAGYSDGGVDACQGDSGGPLMMRIESRWTQLGIVSFGNKCGEPGYPGVYTRVSQYLGWIKDNTKE